MSIIYHIARASDWEQARRDGQYTTSTRGRSLAEEGFIHGSTADQVTPVANLIYKGLPDLVVLVIDTDRVRPEIRYEYVPGWDAPFPHIYGPLNADAVIGTRPLVPGSGGEFGFDAAGDHVEYRRFVPAEADLLAEFLSSEDWPYHGTGAPSADQIRRDAAAGLYDNDQTRTFWIVAGIEVGLIRLLDLADDTPLFDLRIRAAYRGAGLGTQALRWLTSYVFTEFPGIRRIEGTTRQDNRAMRRTFRRCGYVKEAHYRQAWPDPGGTIHDAVGYAILRADWQSGTITTPEWDDEPT